jgi:predicted secreted acid phosphatase
MQDMKATTAADKNVFYLLHNSVESSDLLEKIVHKITSLQNQNAWKPTQKRNGMIIFDVDGTILDNFPRQIAILNKIFYDLPEIREKYLNEGYLQQLNPNPYSLLKHIVEKSRNAHNIRELQPKFLKFFLSNEYLEKDILISGFSTFFQQLLFNTSEDVEIIFLTGRPEQEMREGTIASLKLLGIDLNDNKFQLIMKPNIEMEDYDFKVQVLSALKTDQIQVLAFFDNEPNNCILAKKIFPNAVVVHYLSSQAGNEVFDGPIISKW